MATELLRDNPSPAEAEIRTAISGNLCRCMGYRNPVTAIAAAARDQGDSSNADTPPEPPAA